MRRVSGVVGVDVPTSDVILIQEQTCATFVADDDGFDIDITCAVAGTECCWHRVSLIDGTGVRYKSPHLL